MDELTREEWAQIQLHFDALVGLTPDQQKKRLAKLSLTPNAMEELKSLLAASAMTGLLDKGLPALPAERSSSYSSLKTGDVVGGFVIDRLVGRGGMGEVYSARRASSDFDQHVAVKLLRPEAAGQAGMFDRERRLLAGLEHPGIARLIDGGIAPDGRPFMAMEFIDGQPVTAWCQSNRAPLAKRLSLFDEICAAVSYAHSRLVIHRDIKPSNVLVDSAGHVRLLDFGIAKLVDESGMVSNTTQAMITPDYAAPEQLSNENATVTTDVYALGALLFELLTGKGPWKGENDSLPSIMRRILHEDPQLPSLATLGEAAGLSAATLKGDLDAIVMKAMRRKPEERYASVSEFAEDVRRYTSMRPVRARAGTTRYMLGRFVRRNVMTVAAGAAAALALVTGAVGFAWQAQKTATERDIAVAETRRSESVSDMLTLLFREASDASEKKNVGMKEALTSATDRLLATAKNDPESIVLVTTIADLYTRLEDQVGLATFLEKAKAKGLGKGDPVGLAQIDLRLGSAKASVGKIPEAKALVTSAMSTLQKSPELFPRELLEGNSVLAQIARASGEPKVAVKLLSDTMPLAEQVYADSPRELGMRYNNLLVYLQDAGQFDTVPLVLKRADSFLVRSGLEREGVGLNIRQIKGVMLIRQFRFDEGISALKAVVADRRALTGEDNMALGADLTQLCRAYLAKSDFALAERNCAEGHKIALSSLGPTAPFTQLVKLSWAEAHAELGQVEKAEPLLTDVGKVLLPNPKMGPYQGAFYRTRAILRIRQKRFDEAMKDIELSAPLLRAFGPAGASMLASLDKLRQRVASDRSGS
jgi:eukaryotic-like serine/threonine-protein kinase